MLTRVTRFILTICAVIVAVVLLRPAFAAHDLDLEYAEHQPLATESMFLDISRIGDTLVAVGERGHVVTSHDGVEWTQAEIVPTRSTLTTVYSAGGRLWAGGHDAVIITSGDKGKTWTRQFYDSHRQQAVMDIHFFDESNGVAIGSYGLYLRTMDGGQNWQDATVDPEIDYHLNGLLDMGNGRLLIAGEAGYSYRSYDRGESWEPLDLPYQGSMWGALKTAANCALFFGLRGHVMESCDFGTSWTEIETGTEASISGAAQFEGFVLLAANSGTILTKNDGGPFRVYHHSSGVDFAAAISLGGTHFLLVGEDGVHRYPEVKDDDE